MHDAKKSDREIGLESEATPLPSPGSSGMSEAFVRALNRDYIRISFGPYRAWKFAARKCPSSLRMILMAARILPARAFLMTPQGNTGAAEKTA